MNKNENVSIGRQAAFRCISHITKLQRNENIILLCNKHRGAELRKIIALPPQNLVPLQSTLEHIPVALLFHQCWSMQPASVCCVMPTANKDIVYNSYTTHTIAVSLVCIVDQA